jgi:hypothetical protein
MGKLQPLAVAPVLMSGPDIGYATPLHLPPGHIRDGRELPHRKYPL